jgi:hypothetical protein
MIKESPASPVFILFSILTTFFIVFRRAITAKAFDVDVLLIGNIILVAITLASFFLQLKGLRSTSTAAFLRAIYGGFIIKFFVVAALVFGYAYFVSGKINKPSLFTLMGLYLLYTFVETRALMKMSKRIKNG